MKTDENNNIYKISADYSQVQGQIGILEMKICGRVFLHSKGYWTFDPVFFQIMVKKLQQYFVTYIAPSLFDNVTMD